MYGLKPVPFTQQNSFIPKKSVTFKQLCHPERAQRVEGPAFVFRSCNHKLWVPHPFRVLCEMGGKPRTSTSFQTYQLHQTSDLIFVFNYHSDESRGHGKTLGEFSRSSPYRLYLRPQLRCQYLTTGTTQKILFLGRGCQ